MQEQYQLEKVTMLFADATVGIRNAVKLYAESQQEVELCASVGKGTELLELLRGGLRPQVLVLDALLQQPNIFRLINEIHIADPAYNPKIIVTSVTEATETLEKLLTSGANYTILKPYALDDLFDAVVQWGSDKHNLDVYCIHEHMDRIVCALGVGHKMYGVEYLEYMVRVSILSSRTHSLEELYQMTAEVEKVSPGAIASALHRLVDYMIQKQTSAYAELCGNCGKTADRRLTNTELLREVTNRVRRGMHR